MKRVKYASKRRSLDFRLTSVAQKRLGLCTYHWLSRGLTPGNTWGMVHFWQFFGRAGWGHCLVLETNASDPRDAPPGFGRHWSAVHGFQNPGWTACRHLYSFSWICCTFVLHHAVVQSLGCFTKKKKVCYCRQFRWIRCERWAKFHFVRFRRFRTYIFNILKRACASFNIKL